MLLLLTTPGAALGVEADAAPAVAQAEEEALAVPAAGSPLAGQPDPAAASAGAPGPASVREVGHPPAGAPARTARVEVVRTAPLPAAPGPPPRTAPPAPVAPPASPVAEPIRARREGLQIEVGGQVFVGGAADARDGWKRDVALDRARIEVRGSMPGLLTVIEADVADTKPLKDAFVRLDGPSATRLTAGRFKPPFLERENVSAWKLPRIGRGVVNDYLVDRNELGGRRVGAVGAVRPWDGALEVSAGVFQGTPNGDEKPPQDYVARAAVRLAGALELGAAGYRAGRSAPDAPRREAGSAFAALDAGPLAVSLEALTGRIEQGTFTAGIGLVEYTIPVGKRLRVTPMAGVEALRLRAPAQGTGSSAVGGAVLGFGEGLKLKVQGERARRPGEKAPANAIAVQLATRF
ncbi:hypothetical protein ACOQFB_00830 [Anaeromyxobacter sp. Red801]|uniref:hypothetical protein n=1 Tax=Anaeromyxobacter sp. Red801 TaxID=3411632 RepID=UPI003BA03C00